MNLCHRKSKTRERTLRGRVREGSWLCRLQGCIVCSRNRKKELVQTLLVFSLCGDFLTVNLTNLSIKINLTRFAGLGGIICTVSEHFSKETLARTFHGPFRINLALADCVHRAHFPSLGGLLRGSTNSPESTRIGTRPWIALIIRAPTQSRMLTHTLQTNRLDIPAS